MLLCSCASSPPRPCASDFVCLSRLLDNEVFRLPPGNWSLVRTSLSHVHSWPGLVIPTTGRWRRLDYVPLSGSSDLSSSSLVTAQLHKRTKRIAADRPDRFEFPPAGNIQPFRISITCDFHDTRETPSYGPRPDATRVQLALGYLATSSIRMLCYVFPDITEDSPGLPHHCGTVKPDGHQNSHVPVGHDQTFGPERPCSSFGVEHPPREPEPRTESNFPDCRCKLNT